MFTGVKWVIFEYQKWTELKERYAVCVMNFKINLREGSYTNITYLMLGSMVIKHHTKIKKKLVPC